MMHIVTIPLIIEMHYNAEQNPIEDILAELTFLRNHYGDYGAFQRLLDETCSDDDRIDWDHMVMGDHAIVWWRDEHGWSATVEDLPTTFDTALPS
jgi:hypothetical protein